MKAIAITITALALFVAALALVLIELGWAISILWGWFIVPLGAPAIGIGAAIGISATAAAIRGSRAKPPKREEEDWKAWMNLIMQPLVCVAIGWIVKQFI